MSKIALSLGLKADATDDEILAAMDKKTNDAVAEASKKDAGPEDKALKTLLSMAKSKGMNVVIVTKLAAADFDTALQLVEETKAVTSEAQDTGRVSDLIAELKAGNASQGGKKDERETWTLSDWEKKDSTGLSKMLKSEPAKYQKLFAAKHGFEPSLSDLATL